MNAKQSLTKKELEIMEILWDNDKPLTASDIKEKHTVNPNTVEACLRTLLKKEKIKVADIVYSNTVLCRSYTPVLKRDEYWASCYRQSAGDKNTAQLIARFIDETDDLNEIGQLEDLIQKKKDELSHRGKS